MVGTVSERPALPSEAGKEPWGILEGSTDLGGSRISQGGVGMGCTARRAPRGQASPFLPVAGMCRAQRGWQAWALLCTVTATPPSFLLPVGVCPSWGGHGGDLIFYVEEGWMSSVQERRESGFLVSSRAGTQGSSLRL